MKYQLGDKTLLGEIIGADEIDGRQRYFLDGIAYSVTQIDKIIIKPKRNIDHIIELWESGKSADEIREFMYEKRLSTLVEKVDIQKWLSPYTKPLKLTAEERKALELVKACGYDLLWHDACFLWAHVRGESEAKVADDDFPPLRALKGLFPRATNPTSIDSLLEGTI